MAIIRMTTGENSLPRAGSGTERRVEQGSRRSSVRIYFTAQVSTTWTRSSSRPTVLLAARSQTRTFLGKEKLSLNRAQRNHLTNQSNHRPNQRKSPNLSDRASVSLQG